MLWKIINIIRRQFNYNYRCTNQVLYLEFNDENLFYDDLPRNIRNSFIRYPIDRNNVEIMQIFKNYHITLYETHENTYFQVLPGFWYFFLYSWINCGSGESFVKDIYEISLHASLYIRILLLSNTHARCCHQNAHGAI